MLPFSLAKAITEPVKVIAPMATPSDSSIRLSSLTPVGRRRCRRRRACRWRRRRPGRRPGRPASGRPPPAAASRSCARAGRSPRRPTPPMTTPPSDQADGDRVEQPLRATASPASWRRRCAMPIMPQQVAAPAGHRAGQPAQRQDEEDAGEPDRRAPRGWRSRGRLRPRPSCGTCASMRWVTRKPPKMLTEARPAATAPAPLEIQHRAGRRPHRPVRRGGQQRADDDHRGDRVGDAISGVCSAGVTLQTT